MLPIRHRKSSNARRAAVDNDDQIVNEKFRLIMKTTFMMRSGTRTNITLLGNAIGCDINKFIDLQTPEGLALNVHRNINTVILIEM